jgi:hypothetical protein
VQVLLRHRVYFDPEPGAWWHTEHSALGPGRPTAKPMEPFVCDNKIRSTITGEYQPLLARYTALAAHRAIIRQRPRQSLAYFARAFSQCDGFRRNGALVMSTLGRIGKTSLLDMLNASESTRVLKQRLMGALPGLVRRIR